MDGVPGLEAGRPLARGTRLPSVRDEGNDVAVEQGNIATSRLANASEADPSSSPTESAAADGSRDDGLRRRSDRRTVCWSMNYQEAAIYLQEGRDNDKFETHPRGQDALPAYLNAHHPLFHVVDFVASLLLLSLAMFESPAVPGMRAPIGAHGALEVLGVLVLCIDIILKARWKGLRTLVRHKRSMFKCLLLAVMLVEAIVVLVRHASHVRVTRALRPLFLLNTHYCSGVRRFVRQLLQSLPPILDMLLLLLFFLLTFSVLGYYLFTDIPDSPYFRTFQDSFVSLFVLLTTANYPDVMLPAYAKSPYAAIFFIAYLVVLLYFLMNLLLAVVYDTFSGLEKEKMKKLILHERSACEQAFRLLVSQLNPNGISIRHFVGLMRFYTPRASPMHVYLTFKTLNAQRTGLLSLEEFYGIYCVQNLTWKELKINRPWFHRIRNPCVRNCFAGLSLLVQSKWFEYAMYAIISLNFVMIVVEAVRDSADSQPSEEHPYIIWISLLFVVVYTVEAVLKITGLGLMYFRDAWNILDFVITTLSAIGIIGEFFNRGFTYVLVLRPFRLLRLFNLKKRYRDIVQTLFMLSSRLWSLVVSILMLYYFYGIIGMEFFSVYNLENCCKNSTVEQYFVSIPNGSHGYYYFNNFSDIFQAGVTLFELTVVNNWYITMDAFAIHVSGFTRIYFMVFYLTMMVVMTVVVAFMLEAFVFKIQYGKTMHDAADLEYLQYFQTLSVEEMDMVKNSAGVSWSGRFIRSSISAEERIDDVRYEGKKRRRRIELSMEMYKDEIKEWDDSQTAGLPMRLCNQGRLSGFSRRVSYTSSTAAPALSDDVPLTPPTPAASYAAGD